MLDDASVLKQRDPNDVLGAIAKQYEQQTSDWLRSESAKWVSDVPTSQNYAKQIAAVAVGKTAVFYSSTTTVSVAEKMKSNWNRYAKNLAFCSVLLEPDYSEILGWASHPVEKPFVVFDIVSSFDDDKTLKRFDETDKLLSGRRPRANRIDLAGNSIADQLSWGSVLADFASVYLAILNNVNPSSTKLVEKLKHSLG